MLSILVLACILAIPALPASAAPNAGSIVLNYDYNPSTQTFILYTQDMYGDPKTFSNLVLKVDGTVSGEIPLIESGISGTYPTGFGRATWANITATKTITVSGTVSYSHDGYGGIINYSGNFKISCTAAKKWIGSKNVRMYVVN